MSKTNLSSRRKFIEQTSIGGLGAILIPSLGGCNNRKNRSKDNSIGPIAHERKIGKMTLEQVCAQEQAALFDRFLPNMDSLVIDHEYGGFMCSVDTKTHKLLSTDKSAWYEGRGMWTYSFLFNHFGGEAHFLEVARKSKDFILKHRPKDDDFWVGSYTRDGVPKSGPGNIYGNLFIAEGLAEFAKASEEPQYLDIAKNIALSALKRYDRSDYKYSITYGPPTAKEIPAPRVLGHWMVFLRSATQLLRHESDPEISNLADRCIEAIMEYHLNPDCQLLNEGLSHDLRPAGKQWQQFAYLGHGCETLWMVMDEAVRRKDALLFHETKETFKRHVAVATDALDGGFFRSLDHIDNYIFKTDKVLWLQEEILIGTLMLMEHTDDDWAWKSFEQTYAYIQKKFVHSEYAFVVESGDRKMVDYQTNRAEHYHHPRRLMLNMLALERMINSEGKDSGIFG